MNKILVSLAVALSAFLPLDAAAQNARAEIAERPERAGGVYFAYPTDLASPDYGSAAPKGYSPFYMSHYGRHGSRYLISDDDYRRIMDRLADAAAAGALTARGERLKAQMDTVWEEARGRGGELTPLGSRQHRGIARRAAEAYPQIFADGATVEAASTPVMRCAHSMFAFIEGLKELNPSLQVSRESAPRNLIYLNYHSPESGPYSSHKGPWFQDFKRFKEAQTKPDRLIDLIFSDKSYVDRWVDKREFVWDLYWAAVDIQNMETDTDIMSLFTNDELYDMWQVANFNFFACNSSYPPAKGLHVANARNLVRHIIDQADRCIASGGHGATLRFGHDGNIIPLTALLGLQGCSSSAERPADLADSYADYRISPMAANLQIILFRPDKGGTADDIIARIYLNERDIALPVAPIDGTLYYRWPDLRKHLVSLVYPQD